ncbi:FtsQ-type POTRA domain-containing protein [Candidatus Peregrinibacteria bacterium]|nr:FtsQ-type POTRA domain-containing protein [Candidatus Peregrinibacteria bacterium]
MIFRRKRPKRLYYPTRSSWYRKPRKERLSVRTSRKIFSHNIRTHVTHFLKNFLLYIVIGVIFIGLLLFLFFSSRFTISKIEIARADLHIDSSVVSNMLAPYKGNSIFTFSKTKVSNQIKEAYPEFARVEIKKLLPNTIKVELETHEIVANIKAYYVLPKVEPELTEEEEKMLEITEALKTAFDLEAEVKTDEKEQVVPIEQKALLNRIGQAIFDREEDLQLMTITIDGLSQPLEDRAIVIPTPYMDIISNCIKYFTNVMQMEIKSIHYLPVAREIHLTTEGNLVLWLSIEKGYKEQIDKLHTIYKVAELDKEDLAYIDLRVKEKIIYCPRGAQCDR